MHRCFLLTSRFNYLMREMQSNASAKFRIQNTKGDLWQIVLDTNGFRHECRCICDDYLLFYDDAFFSSAFVECFTMMNHFEICDCTY